MTAMMPINQLKPNPKATVSEEHVDMIVQKKLELLVPITENYEVIGMWDYLVAKKLGLQEVAVQVVPFENVLDAHGLRSDKNKSYPVEYAWDLKQALEYPGITVEILAEKIGKSVKEIQSFLTINELPRYVQVLIEGHCIPLETAFLLAKLSEYEIDNNLLNAIKLTSEEFANLFRSIKESE